MDKVNRAVIVSATKNDHSNEVKAILQIAPVSIESAGNKLNTYNFQRPTVSFID